MAGTTRGSPSRTRSRNVEGQRADPGSTLHFTRDLIALRRRLESLRAGAYAELSAPAGSWAWRRGDDATIALNLGAEPVAIDGVEGVDRTLDEPLLATASRWTAISSLAPSEGAIVSRA